MMAHIITVFIGWILVTGVMVAIDAGLAYLFISMDRWPIWAWGVMAAVMIVLSEIVDPMKA